MLTGTPRALALAGVAAAHAGPAATWLPLLHDTDATAAPGCWRATLTALPYLVAWCGAAGWAVGPAGRARGPRSMHHRPFGERKIFFSRTEGGSSDRQAEGGHMMDVITVLKDQHAEIRRDETVGEEDVKSVEQA